MRMWMLSPKLMCKKHISGEHGEIHKHLSSLYKGIKIDGRYAHIAQIQLNALQSRHDQLAQFLNHKSPIEVDDYWIYKLYPQYYHINVNLEFNLHDLMERCEKCRNLILKKRRKLCHAMKLIWLV